MKSRRQCRDYRYSEVFGRVVQAGSIDLRKPVSSKGSEQKVSVMVGVVIRVYGIVIWDIGMVIGE